jgi:cation diffusion facilitator CzcD-associated flavoprotein CzcO
VIDVAAIGAMPTGLRPDVAVTDVVAARFDDLTGTWRLTTRSGDTHIARVVVDAERTFHQPWLPTFPGHTHFHGPIFHTATWDTTFEPAGRRMAVIGDRAAHVTPLLKKADVALFDCPPDWQTRTAKPSWRPRLRYIGPRRVSAPVDRITESGIRTADGADHDVDAIIYATGCTIAPGIADDALVGSNGLKIRDAWRSSATAYLGVAAHGFPNYFVLNGPDSPIAADTHQVEQIAECLDAMARHDALVIEVRRSAQTQYTRRARTTTKAFDFTQGREDGVYDGPATLTVGGDDHPVRVRLTGHLDPIDGKYHWQGMVFGASADLPRQVAITMDSLTTEAKITERTPWGGYSIAGVGAPPYAIS